MADDRHDDASQEGSPPKNSSPADLETTEISGAADDAGSADVAETTDDQQSIGGQSVGPPRAPSRSSSAVSARLPARLQPGLWLAPYGRRAGRRHRPSCKSLPRNLVLFRTALRSVKSKSAKPAAWRVDPAAAARIDTLEKSVASLGDELSTVRGQSDSVAAAVKDGTSGPREAADAPDLAAISARLAEVEKAAKTLPAETTGHDTAPADDVPLRRVVAATLLNVSVRQGQPYGELLAASKALIADPDTLKPLEMFADSGVPSANVLCHELLTIVPKLAPSPVMATTGTDIVTRLREGAARLVSIERADAPAGNSTGAVVAGAAASARQNDVAAARGKLNALPPADRTAAEPWIAKADARAAALAASGQFAADAMAALTKPAP